MAEPKRDVAGVVAFPPLVYAAPLLASILVDRVLAKKRLSPQARVLSLGFFAGAISFIAPAFVEFKRAGTPVDVLEETTTIVERGPYAYTRNPLYLGLTLTYIGVALAARTRLPLAVLPVVIAIMNAGVIGREERYLERKFGETYLSYKNRVPRWI